MSGELVALVTCPQDKAEELAVKIVEHRLAACVNIVGGIKSIYHWEGKIESNPESLLIIKTNREVYDEFEKTVQELHPYDVPEIICLAVDVGNQAYLNWLNQCLVTKERKGG